MTKKYKNYTDNDIIEAAKNVSSLGQLLKVLDLKAAGGNYSNMKRNLQRLEVDTSHWTGKSWSKGQQLKDWSEYTRVSGLKPHLIKKRGHVCQSCDNSKWLCVPIPLEVEHVDGDKTNNQEKNLKLLCPNCHALTPTWRRKKSSLQSHEL